MSDSRSTPFPTEIADAVSTALRAPLGRVEARREELAKEWLVGAIRNAPLSRAGTLPLEWASEQLPELITDVLVAACDGGQPILGRAARERSRQLGTLRPGLTPSRLAEELSALQSEVGRAIVEELDGAVGNLLAEATARTALAFGQVSGEAQESLMGALGPEESFVFGIKRPDGLRRRVAHMIEAYRRHDQPFALTVFDVEGPGSENVGVVAAELRQGIRALDETYRLEEDELCVLAPFQQAGDGVKMAERLAARLSELESRERWDLTISAGVAACPEHGDDAESLLTGADTAMWRARATGRPVAVADRLSR